MHLFGITHKNINKYAFIYVHCSNAWVLILHATVRQEFE